MSELKPCPVCGGKAKIKDWQVGYETGTTVICGDCEVYISESVVGGNGWHDRAVSKWNRRATTTNEPLTLDELRGMDGEPVWIVCGIYKDWRIPEFIDEGAYKEFIKFSDRSAEPISDYGKHWLAYRRKPEGGAALCDG